MANVKFEYNGKLSDGRFLDEDSKKKVSIELEDDNLTVNEMLEEFMNFMKAIGYNFELGDYLEVVNDFKTEKKDDLKIDLGKYGSDPAYGAVPPQPIVDEGGGVIGMAMGAPAVRTPTVSPTDNYTQEELIAEIGRLRSMTMGVSEEGLEIAARNNLRYRDV